MYLESNPVAGIILKMAQPIKDTSVGGQINTSDVVRKPETMIIPAHELVQVFAKVCSPSKQTNNNSLDCGYNS